MTRCVHVTGMVHEIGIWFKDRIAPAEHLDSDPMAGQFSLESVEPETLAGTLLHVEDRALEQKLIQHYLRGTNLRLRVAETAPKAADAALEGCDIVLCGDRRGNAHWAGAVRAVRDALPRVPVIVVAEDSSPATMERIRRMRVDAFLARPFTDAMLQRALGEFLLARAPAATICASRSARRRTA